MTEADFLFGEPFSVLNNLLPNGNLRNIAVSTSRLGHHYVSFCVCMFRLYLLLPRSYKYPNFRRALPVGRQQHELKSVPSVA